MTVNVHQKLGKFATEKPKLNFALCAKKYINLIVAVVTNMSCVVLMYKLPNICWENREAVNIAK